jgi:two-component SAPR family response regulator
VTGVPLKLLILEDEILVAMYLEEMLSDMGHSVISSANRVNEAMDVVRDCDIDFAVLDVNIAGTPSFPVADMLRKRGIPFVFATGYGQDSVAQGFGDHPTLCKPYAPESLKLAIAEGLLSTARSRPV